LNLLRYGMLRDGYLGRETKKILVITCCDQIDGEFLYTIDGVIYSQPTKEAFGLAVVEYLDIESFITVDDSASVEVT